MEQCPQLPPQEDFPFFLFLTLATMINTTIAIRTAQTMIVPIFAAIQDNISAGSFHVYLS